VILADGKRITTRNVELIDTLTALPPQALKRAREGVEREMVQRILRRHSGRITSVAIELGVPPAFYERMDMFGIAKEGAIVV